uniref:superoxide dismutase n=1 Tax=Rhinella marina TaxID=8386 RepID=A0A1B2RVC8_RHIMB|nr:globin Y [Rhinella marina]
MADLTAADIENINEIWCKIYANPEESGKTVVIRLFTTYPQTKVYFKNLKNIATLEEMQVNPGIRAHGKGVMGALNQVIQNLNDWEVVSSALTHLAQRHQDVHKVGVNNFQLLFLVILTIFKEALGADFTPEHCKSWEKLFSITYNFLGSCYTKSDS